MANTNLALGDILNLTDASWGHWKTGTSPWLMNLFMRKFFIEYKLRYLYLNKSIGVELEGIYSCTRVDSVYLKYVGGNIFICQSIMDIVPEKDYLIVENEHFKITGINKTYLSIAEKSMNKINISSIQPADGKYSVYRSDYLIPLNDANELQSILDAYIFKQKQEILANQVLTRVRPARCPEGFQAAIDMWLKSNFKLVERLYKPSLVEDHIALVERFEHNGIVGRIYKGLKVPERCETTQVDLFRWHATDNYTCEKNNNTNTGKKIIEEIHQKSINGGATWADTVPRQTRNTAIMEDLISCPINIEPEIPPIDFPWYVTLMATEGYPPTMTAYNETTGSSDHLSDGSNTVYYKIGDTFELKEPMVGYMAATIESFNASNNNDIIGAIDSSIKFKFNDSSYRSITLTLKRRIG